MTIKVCAKCSDMFGATLVDSAGKTVGVFDGYVPNWFPAPNVEHYGDYVELEIDVATGRILNWKKPTAENLKDFKA